MTKKPAQASRLSAKAETIKSEVSDNTPEIDTGTDTPVSEAADGTAPATEVKLEVATPADFTYNQKKLTAKTVATANQFRTLLHAVDGTEDGQPLTGKASKAAEKALDEAVAATLAQINSMLK
jgi:hypothetical protein